MSAREEMLGRIREALGPAPVPPEVPRAYRQAGRVAAGSPELLDLFCERVADYQATVARTDDERLEEAIAAACASRGSTGVVRAPGGDDLTAAELDEVDAAITGCALAIAETGTIVLDGGRESGRRALTLVPDHHICVVRAEQVVADLPDAIERLADAAREGRPLTFVSGPSATSDIELERVEGVHGPRKLDVLVVG